MSKERMNQAVTKSKNEAGLSKQEIGGSIQRRMLLDEGERPLQEIAPRRYSMPGRRAGRVRQRNQIEASTGTPDAKRATDDLVEFLDRDELRDRQFADRNDETRLQDFDLAVEPR